MSTKDPTQLCEMVRQRLARTICAQLWDDDQRLHVITLDPVIEDQLNHGLEQGEHGISMRLSTMEIESTCRAIGSVWERSVESGRPPVLLVGAKIRPFVKQLTSSRMPHLTVISYNEITTDTKVQSVGIVTNRQAGE